MKKLIVITGIFYIVFAHSLITYSQNTIVSAEQVKGILEGAGKHMLIDARSRDEYRDGHIPGALNIPPERMHGDRKRLPRDKSTTIVFYCRGVG